MYASLPGAFVRTALAGALVTALATGAAASPNLAEPRPVGKLTVYPDDRRPGLFFYGPGELAVVRRGDGGPDLHFVQTRYTGTTATGDRGRLLYQGLLSVRVAMQAPTASELDSARRALAAGPLPIELRPLPIRRLEAALVYAPVGRSEAASPLPPGHFEDGEPGAPQDPEAFWTTRSYVLGLEPVTSELFAGALARGQVVLSLSYAFYAAGVGAASPNGQLVRASVFAIAVDAGKWPDVLRRADINERVPPGYPLLDVYCYDFRDSLRPALYEKAVEVEAEGMGGRPVVAGARFGRDQPDLYARGLRFGVAVHLDRPYRYRVTEVTDDGRSTVTPWRQRASWADLLDVTGGER